MPGSAWIVDNPPSTRWPLYTRGNVGEVFPVVVWPYTWLQYGTQAELGWRDAFADLGLLVPSDLEGEGDFVILGIFGGYCYINASYVRLLGVRAPGSSVETIDQQFFGESEAPEYVARPGDKNVRASLRIARTVWRVLRATDLPDLRTDEQLVARRLGALPGADAPDAAFISYLDAHRGVFRDLFRRHILTSFCLTIGAGMVTDLCRDRLGEPGLELSLLAGIGDVESARPAVALWSLSRLDPESDEYRAGFARFVDEFGFRGPNEWELASRSWAEQPEAVVAMIDRLRSAPDDNDPRRLRAELEARRQAAIGSARRRLSTAHRFVFDRALRSATVYSQGRERSKTTVIRAHDLARRAVRVLAARAADRGGTPDLPTVCALKPDELAGYLESPGDWLGVIDERLARKAELDALVPPFVFESVQPDPETWARRGSDTTRLRVGESIDGIGGCPGSARGRARVVLDPAAPGDLGPGDVLVAPITDPSWTPLFNAAAAVVVDVGAVLSHAVIVSRELGIPCVVSATDATSRIPDGALIEVNGTSGRVTLAAD